jgi:hypothetical protein
MILVGDVKVSNKFSNYQVNSWATQMIELVARSGLNRTSVHYFSSPTTTYELMLKKGMDTILHSLKGSVILKSERKICCQIEILLSVDFFTN